MVAESGGVCGGGLSHGEGEERGVGRGEKGEGGVGGGVEEIELEIGSGYGVGEEIVASSSDNGEHCVELLRRNGGDEGVFGEEEGNHEKNDIEMESDLHSNLKRH